ncbi:putative oxidoreductase [Mycolicibacterium iranicum]|uniref:Putative oxidoreductase n=1 Tax=Mycolicibacterium iranicum TaxID=912594 RepID=A0A839QLF9_MYCIR|nr:DoxX family protein [Mycolicibacterium iranicum]MBB2993041.1 putative oxidoreductase [Mycolicibacterium iranicum]
MARVAGALKLDPALGLFIFRVVVGFLFTLHGTVKIFGWPNGGGKAAEFAAWPSWWAGLIELVAGLLVMSGLFTRAAAFLASGTMAVAYFWKHQPDGLFPIQNDGDSAALYCFAFLLLVFTGGGAFALDTLRVRRAAGAEPSGHVDADADRSTAPAGASS